MCQPVGWDQLHRGAITTQQCTYMFAIGPTTPPTNLTQGPTLAYRCKHESVLGSTSSKTVSSEILWKAGFGGECVDQVLNHFLCHFSGHIWNAVGSKVGKYAFFGFQTPTKKTFEVVDPQRKVGVHVNLRDILLVDVINVTCQWWVRKSGRHYRGTGW